MDVAIGKLQRHILLHPEEKQSLREAFSTERTLVAGEDLIRQGSRPGFCGALLSGLLSRHVCLADGTCQIVGISVPGDIFELQSFTLGRTDHAVGALMNARVAVATHQSIAALSRAFPRLSMLLWRESMIDAAILREWVVNCGRRSAYARTAHLFCELYVRLEAVGLAHHGGFALPLTQAVLSDATGLSVVHVNRVLQQLRSDGFISFKAGRLTVRDRSGLAAAAGFDPSYLHMEDPIDLRAEVPVEQFPPWPGRDLAEVL